MPNVRISDLPPVVLPLTGTEVLEITQNGLSYKVTSSELANPPGLLADFVTLSANVDLPNERILTAGGGISIVDGGPGLDVTISSTVVPGGQVNSVVSGVNITVDATDPVNPIVNLDNPVVADLTGDVNGVTISNAGPATNYLDESGNYSVPPGAGGGSLAALSDVDLTGQAQYDLLFNVDGTNWEDTAGDLIFDTAALALQLANGYAINMVDSGATSRRVLEIGSSGSPSVTIEHATVEVVGEVSTVSNVEVPVTGGTLPALTDGNDYLLIACAQHHQGNTGGENIHGADIAVATGSGVPLGNMRDDIEPPACAVASNQGQWFGGINSITYTFAAYGLITLEHSAGATATHYVNNAILMAFNLTDFGVQNTDWFRSVTAPFVTVTDAGWTNLSPTITIGDGVSDWLLFGSFQCDQPNVADAQIQFGLFDGSVNTEYAMHQFADTADIKSIFFSAVLQGIASTTFQTAARAVAAGGDTARIFTSGIYALRLNRFAQYSVTAMTGPTSPGSGAEFSLLTDSIVATTNSDWGIMAFVRNQWIANTLSGTTYGRANINAGGFSTIAGFDTPPQAVVENATSELTPKFLTPRIAELTGVVPTDTVGAELRWIPPVTFGPTRANQYYMVMFTWDTFDSSVEATTLGDPALDTQIDGLSISIAGAYTLPLVDGAAGQVLQTDGAGTVSFSPVSTADPFIVGSVNATSNAAINLTDNVAALNIGNTAIPGTLPLMQINSQFIQAKSSKFGTSTIFINSLGGDIQLGNGNFAGIFINEPSSGVQVRHSTATVAFRSALPASGGLEANNLATGVGFERVLTTSDLGGGASPGGANTAVQFNNAGAFGGSPNFEWDGSILKIEASQAAIILDETDGGGTCFLRLTSTTTADSALVIEWSSSTGTNGAIRQATSGGTLQDIWIQFQKDAGVGLYFDGLQQLITVVGGVRLPSTGGSSLYIDEKAAANADIATQGQLWVRTDPFSNTLMFTNDNGNEFEVAGIPYNGDLLNGTGNLSGTTFAGWVNIGPKPNTHYMITITGSISAPAADDGKVQMSVDTNSIFVGMYTDSNGQHVAFESAIGEVVTNTVIVDTDGSANPDGTYFQIIGHLITGVTGQTVSLRAAKNADAGADGGIYFPAMAVQQLVEA